MSWQIFKRNLINRLCDAKQVPDIETVAKAFAQEYDAAVKRGGTIPDNIKVTTGNVEAMEKLFLVALQNGLSKTQPYDLVGQMGKGVKAYWATAQLAPFPIPIPTPVQLSTGVISNISSVSNTITYAGDWKAAEDASESNTRNTDKKLEEDDSDVVNNKVNEKETDPDEKPMPSLNDDFNLYQIPDGLNNYRSAQIPVRIKGDGSLEGPFPDIIKRYGIKTIIRMNGDGSDGRKSKKWPITSKATEEQMCKILGCTYVYINAHGPEEPGNGYQVTNKKITEILKQGNVLIHCAHGADRTGGHVAGYLKKTGVITDIDRLWEYTIQYNSWMYYIKTGKYFGTGYEKYGNTFYPQDLLRQKFANGVGDTKKVANTAKEDGKKKPKVLIVGDSISVDAGYTWSSLYKKLKTDVDVEILAKGGEQLTSWMGPQLQAKLKTQKYDKVYIYGGVNDSYSGKTAASILNALQTMVNLVIANGGQAIVVTGYDAEIDMGDNSTKPTKLVKTKAEMEKLLEVYRVYQKSISSTIKNAVIVPKISVGVLSDGFHPTGQQPRKLYEHIAKY